MTKKDHKAGDVLDSIGGYSMRAFADRIDDAKRDNLVPIGLLQGAKVVRDLPIDTLITWDDIELDESQTIVALRREMDALGL
jgi:predicted homoserine dehydrogenase-like protein